MWGRVSREQVLRQPNLFSVLPACESKSAARPEPQEGSEEWGRRRPGILGATCSTCSCTCRWHKQQRRRRRQQHTLNRVRLHTARVKKKKKHKRGKFSESVCDSPVCLVQCHFEGAVANRGRQVSWIPPEGGASQHRVPWGIVLLFLCPVGEGCRRHGNRKRRLAGSGFIPRLCLRSISGYGVTSRSHGVLWCRLTAESLSGWIGAQCSSALGAAPISLAGSRF